MIETDVPWAALYRRALMHGISDEAFWAMSTAALCTITAGMGRKGGRTPAGRTSSALRAPSPKGKVYMAGGGLADCP